MAAEQCDAKFNKQAKKSNRQLPLRSKNIDLSSYLNKNLDSSTSSDSSTSPLSSPSRSSARASPSLSSTSSSSSSSTSKSLLQVCSFCQNNGESEEIYTSHPLKDSLSRIVCPILRNFTCPRCGESGDYAHTNKYCPHTQRKAKADKIKNALSTLN